MKTKNKNAGDKLERWHQDSMDQAIVIRALMDTSAEWTDDLKAEPTGSSKLPQEACMFLWLERV